MKAKEELGMHVNLQRVVGDGVLVIKSLILRYIFVVNALQFAYLLEPPRQQQL